MARSPRVTLFFTDGKTGWTETHYDVTVSNLQSAVARAIGGGLIYQRNQIMADGPWLQYVRASYDDTFRDAQVAYLPTPQTTAGGVYQSSSIFKGTQAAVEWTTCMLRGVNGDLYRKQIYLSAIPFSDPTDINSPQGDPRLVGAINAYANVLTTGYGFPVWLRDVQTFPFRPITAVNAAANPQTITVPNHGFSAGVGKRVFIQKFKFLGTAPFNGNGPWFITAIVDQNTLALANWTFPAGNTFLTGEIQSQTRDVVPYNQIAIVRYTHRKRGRPFDSPVGRSRKKTRSAAP